MKHIFITALAAAVLFGSCKKETIKDNTALIKTNSVEQLVEINTDKAYYKPGDKINFTLSASVPSTVKIRYMQAGNIVESGSLSGQQWTWTAPAADFSGYLAELYDTVDGNEKIYGTIAIDVSSDPARFPRNGFLSAFGQMDAGQINGVMKDLNRYHMNYVQFQDWTYKHHLPLAGTVSSPDATWKDIANRDNYAATVKGYITAAHSFNMKALSYNLAYGALNDAAADGVAESWYMFTDAQHTNKDLHALGAPFKSSIYLTNPGNTDWQGYIAQKTKAAYQVYPFDGYQIDQLGDRGKTLYDFDGRPIDLLQGFNSFIKAMKAAAPDKALVMNAVNQYGQDQIANAPVDFLYSEVWAGNESYASLGQIIKNNDAQTNGQKRSVLAAYMDYDLANSQGFFNTSGVLLTDAVIFAFGGSHLEVGEHMLGKEYFPNSNLQMRDDLKTALVTYYDFLTAYQNLLRDGGTFNNPAITAGDNQLKLNNWPPQSGQVSVIGRDLGSKQVIHLINMANTNSLNWRDNNGTQAIPVKIQNPRFNFSANRAIKRIWMASPDLDGGASKEIKFTQSGNTVTFSLPSLWYWDMIVVEY